MGREIEMPVAEALLAHRLMVPAPEEARAALKANPLPWPDGLAPQPVAYTGVAGGALPRADVLVVTWTTAESQALADVLSGVDVGSWMPYTDGWASYESQLTWRSPAREEKCMAKFALAEINGLRVLLAKSELHLSTDSVSLPIRKLWQQMLEQVHPKLAISTGTAGGIGVDESLGDVVMTARAKFNCTKAFKDEPFAQSAFEDATPTTLSDDRVNEAEALMKINAGKLAPIATRAPLVITRGDVETVDYFAFADTEDSYGVVSDDPQAKVEEMDDAVLGLVCEQDLGGVQPWLLIRNASDPQVPRMGSLAAEAEWAARIYQKYGYWTSVGSAICCWAAICSL